MPAPATHTPKTHSLWEPQEPGVGRTLGAWWKKKREPPKEGVAWQREWAQGRG